MNTLHSADKLVTTAGKTSGQQLKFKGFINRLYEAILNRKRQEVIVVILESLTMYTMQQFRYEECLMQSHGHSDIQLHKDQHTALLKKLIDFKIKYKEGNDNLGIELVDFLKNQLFDHIASSDSSMYQYINEKERELT
jgi:hemerythrin-like metal-binding protein